MPEINIGEYTRQYQEALVAAEQEGIITTKKKEDNLKALKFFADSVNFMNSAGHEVKLCEEEGRDRYGCYMRSENTESGHNEIRIPVVKSGENYCFNLGEKRDSEIGLTLAHEALHGVDHFMYEQECKKDLPVDGEMQETINREASTGSYAHLSMKRSLQTHAAGDVNAVYQCWEDNVSSAFSITVGQCYPGRFVRELMPRLFEEKFENGDEIFDSINGVTNPQEKLLTRNVLQSFGTLAGELGRADFREASIANNNFLESLSQESIRMSEVISEEEEEHVIGGATANNEEIESEEEYSFDFASESKVHVKDTVAALAAVDEMHEITQGYTSSRGVTYQHDAKFQPLASKAAGGGRY